jgi:hypothetical protein
MLLVAADGKAAELAAEAERLEREAGQLRAAGRGYLDQVLRAVLEERGERPPATSIPTVHFRPDHAVIEWADPDPDPGSSSPAAAPAPTAPTTPPLPGVPAIAEAAPSPSPTTEASAEPTPAPATAVELVVQAAAELTGPLEVQKVELSGPLEAPRSFGARRSRRR